MSDIWRSLFPGRHDIRLGSYAPMPLGLHWPCYWLDERAQRSMALVVGMTGSGKSKLLLSLFTQHVRKQHGAAIIEPHHDLSIESLAMLLRQGYFRANPRAYDDLIYLDWGNGRYVPWNILDREGQPWVDDATLALNVLDAMVRVWPELEHAPTFHTLFLSAVTVLIANALPITFIYQLLTDKPFRDRCLARTAGALPHQVFNDWYDRLGRDQMDTAGSTLRRAFLLSFSPYTRLTFGQPTCRISLRRLMDEGKSIIIDLGHIQDDETRQLIGAILLKQFEQAAFSRRDTATHARRPFVAFIDEFQLFAAQERTIGNILAQARKHGFTMVLATQSLSGITSDRLNATLENCRLKISFGLGHDSAVLQARTIAAPDPYSIKDAPLTDTQHPQFLGVGEQYVEWQNALKDLGPRYFYLKNGNQPPVLLKSPAIPSLDSESAALRAVTSEYGRRYQLSEAEAEAAIAEIRLPEDDVSRTPAFARAFRPATSSERDHERTGT